MYFSLFLEEKKSPHSHFAIIVEIQLKWDLSMCNNSIIDCLYHYGLSLAHQWLDSEDLPAMFESVILWCRVHAEDIPLNDILSEVPGWKEYETGVAGEDWFTAEHQTRRFQQKTTPGIYWEHWPS